MKGTASRLYPFPIRPYYACRHIPLQAESNKNNAGRNSDPGWMLSRGEDEPGFEALPSEPGLGRLVLVRLPLGSHVGAPCGGSSGPKPQPNPDQSDLEKCFYPHWSSG